MTQNEMNILVPQKLHQIEEQFGVKVLLAVESGSRAWGFASPDSDFDVRFIYKRAMNQYLKLNASRDVIEIPVDDTWDVCGWDLDKTLRLLHKSNPTLFEWLQSPICYCKTEFAERISPLMQECFSVKHMLYHYLNTARHTIKDHLQGEMVRPKKYFYALRPVLACFWVLQHQTAPPVLFDSLVAATLPDTIQSPLNYLLDIKMHAPEKTWISPVAEIDVFLSESITYLEAVMKDQPKDEIKSWDAVNRFFLSEISGVYESSHTIP